MVQKQCCVCVYIYANEVRDKQVVNWVKCVWQFLVLFLCSCKLSVNLKLYQSKNYQKKSKQYL